LLERLAFEAQLSCVEVMEGRSERGAKALKSGEIPEQRHGDEARSSVGKQVWKRPSETARPTADAVSGTSTDDRSCGDARRQSSEQATRLHREQEAARKTRRKLHEYDHGTARRSATVTGHCLAIHPTHPSPRLTGPDAEPATSGMHAAQAAFSQGRQAGGITQVVGRRFAGSAAFG
jgi:hypothetical protein